MLISEKTINLFEQTRWFYTSKSILEESYYAGSLASF